MSKTAEQMPDLSSQLTFFTAWFCPFAQRTEICLEEKGVAYTRNEVSLKKQSGLWYMLDEKPHWFLRLNPLGRISGMLFSKMPACYSPR
jgi:glutathione S-transferase